MVEGGGEKDTPTPRGWGPNDATAPSQESY